MRLTHTCEYADKRKNKEPITKIRDKLFKLENIEELCIKMTTQPVYKKALNGKICNFSFTKCNASYDFKNNCIVLYTGWFCATYFVNEYGKTWAFTREELEDE